MALQEILGVKDPSGFRSRQVASRVSKEVYTEPFGDEMNFGALMGLRKPQDPEAIRRGLEKGYVFANMGVSGVLTTTLGGEDYLMLVRQDRTGGDFNDSVAKNVSGYIEAKNLANPRAALDTEIAEEVLPCDGEGRVIGGVRQGQELPRVFSKEVGVEYAPVSYQLGGSAKFNLPDSTGLTLAHQGEPQEGADFYFHSPTNSMQAVYRYHIDFPAGCGLNSLNHSEDKMNDKKQLEVRLQPEGIILVKLKEGRITSEAYVLKNGVLRPFERKIVLSEAFAPKKSGIVNVNNIPLEEVLARQ